MQFGAYLFAHRVMGALYLAVGLTTVGRASSAVEPNPFFRLATFSADVTVPAGHGMMGGAWLSKSVADPLEAHGLVLLGKEKPVVFVAVDWCEIRNEAMQRWQEVLAEAASTEPERVMVSTVHQHDAPVADLAAERILRDQHARGTVCDLAFHEIAVQHVAKALRESLRSTRPVTHLGFGQAEVERIASNRRYLLTDGSVRFDRMSATRDPVARYAPRELDRSVAQDSEFLGRRYAPSCPQCLRRTSHELLRAGRGLG